MLYWVCNRYLFNMFGNILNNHPLKPCKVLGFSLLLGGFFGGLSASPLKPHLLEPEAYSEVYTVFLELDNGVHAQIKLAVSNIGVGDGNGMCGILYIDEQGAMNAGSRFSKKDMDFSVSDRLKIGTCSIVLTKNKIRVQALVKQNSIDVELLRKMQVIQPPGHLIQTEDGFFDQQLLLQWAPIRLKAKIENRSAVETTGYGCIYHYWVTALPQALASNWIRVFGVAKEGAFYLNARFLPKSQEVSGSLWMPGDKSPVTLQGAQLVWKDKKRYKIKFLYKGKRYGLLLTRQLFREAPVEQAGVVLGGLIKMIVGNPVTYTYRASFDPGVAGLPARVIAEVIDFN